MHTSAAKQCIVLHKCLLRVTNRIHSCFYLSFQRSQSTLCIHFANNLFTFSVMPAHFSSFDLRIQTNDYLNSASKILFTFHSIQFAPRPEKLSSSSLKLTQLLLCILNSVDHIHIEIRGRRRRKRRKESVVLCDIVSLSLCTCVCDSSMCVP